jgi:hypothetical protein
MQQLQYLALSEELLGAGAHAFMYIYIYIYACIQSHSTCTHILELTDSSIWCVNVRTSELLH